jgi:hypothetical protein
LRRWFGWHREQMTIALDSKHGAIVAELVEFLKSMSLQSAPDLIALLRRRDWSVVDIHIRCTVLHAINVAITRLRTRAGLPEFDDLDAVLHGRPNGFLVAKAILCPEPPPPSAASPGTDTGPINPHTQRTRIYQDDEPTDEY